MLPRIVPVLVAALLLAGCTRPQEAGGPAPGDDVKVRVGDVTPAPPRDVQVGSGGSSTFDAAAGLVRVELHTAAPGDWDLALEEADGDVVDTILDGEGPYDGARWVAVPGGSYVLNFSGEGDWNATVAVDRRDAVPPQTWEGTGDGATWGVRLEKGTATFDVSSDGPMRAWLVAPDGGTLLTLASTRNATQEQVRASIPASGVYVVNVESENAWTIRVEA